MAGAGLLIALCAWFVIRQMRKHSAQIQDILSNEQLKNRNVEISFMGDWHPLKSMPKKRTPAVFCPIPVRTNPLPANG